MAQSVSSRAWGVVFAAAVLLLVSCGKEGTASQASQDGKKDKGGGSTPAVRFEAAYVFIPIEAESAEKVEGEIMRIVEDKGAWGGKCIEIPDKAGTPWGKPPSPKKLARAVYRFTIRTPGNYTFWCRRWWKDQCGDTFAVRFDREGEPRTLEPPGEYLFGADDSSKPPRWGWSPVFVKGKGKPRQFFLDAGTHVMEILNLEDGPRFDVVLLTNDRDFVPYRGLRPEDIEEP